MLGIFYHQFHLEFYMILGRKSPEEGHHAGSAKEPDTEPPTNENVVLTELKPASVLGLQMPAANTPIRTEQQLQFPCKDIGR